MRERRLTNVDLALIDRMMGDLRNLRAAVASECPCPSKPDPEPDFAADDFAPENLIDTATASERFDMPIDTVRWLCRNKGRGQKEGKNRWLASVMAFRRYLERP